MNRNRLNQLLLIIALLLCGIEINAYDFKLDGIYYNIVSDTEMTVEVTHAGNDSKVKYSGKVEIPESVTYNSNVYRVVMIGFNAFKNCNELESVSIPYGVTTIEQWAFYNCSNLIAINIPESITSFGYQVFYGCSSITEITIPNGVTYISAGFFSGCNQLTSVTLGNQMSTIDSKAFMGCYSLQSITIPKSVNKIGDQVFNGCISLKEVIFEDGESPLELGHESWDPDRTGEGLFFDCPLERVCLGRSLTYSAKQSFGYSPFANKETFTSIVISDSVKSIGPYLFYGCKNLTNIVIPESVTDIGYCCFDGYEGELIINCNVPSHTFYHCKITKVTFGKNVTSIGDEAFEGCEKLTSITFPKGVRHIGKRAFIFCKGLTTIALPDSLTTIEELTFTGTGISTINIPKSVTSIGYRAFGACKNLSSIVIPKSVTIIKDDAFGDCESLQELTFEDGGKELTLGCNIFSYSTQDLGEGLFHDCPLKKVYLGRNLTFNDQKNYGYSPFYNKTELQKVIIGDSVTKISAFTFFECQNIDSIVINKNVKSIQSYAFGHCKGNFDLYCYTDDVPNTTYTSFEGTNLFRATLHAHPKLLPIYKSTYPWNEFGMYKAFKVPISNISLNHSSIVIKEGDTLYLTATISPEYAENTSLIWSSNNPSVASVDKQGKVVAIVPGIAIITATADDGSGVSASCEITVEGRVIHVTQITLSHSSASLTEGETLSITATITPNNADNTSITWSSSNANVAIVDANGNVTAKAPGTATITATANDGSGISASCEITVNEIILGKCATPIISYADGQVSLTCETEGAKVITSVANVDDDIYEESVFDITPTYTINAYATKAQYEDSDVATITLCWINCTEEHENDQESGVINVHSKAVLIQSHNGIITLSGLEDDTEVAAYSTAGARLATAIATNGTATLNTNLQSGTVVIIKFGNKSVKIKI